MRYNVLLADKVREYLAECPNLDIEEKKMFGGLAFLINGKMCINISGQNLMCRFDPDHTEELSFKTGFMSMIMKGKELKGYCYVEPEGIKTKNDFELWLNLCIAYNDKVKSSKK